MKVVVTGTRGIYGIQGGVETHCEELYPRLVELGCDVTVLRRSCYVRDDNRIDWYKGIRIIDTYAPHSKALEAIIHTALAVIKARLFGADIVHIHAVGPGLCVPLARLLGMRVIATNHGPDYDRQKWGKLARTILKMGEWCQAKFSHKVIVISPVIADILAKKYGREDTVLIPNGVNKPKKATEFGYLQGLGLEPKRYVLCVGRFVPEKGFDLIIKAWEQMTLEQKRGCKLVIAGDADHKTDYSRELKALANRCTDVVLTGFIKGDKLNQIFSGATLFAMPSYHEGLPIALLEAMSYDLDVLASDIPADRLPELDKDGDFFACGDSDALRRTLMGKLANGQKERHHDLSRYDWDSIAKATYQEYEKLMRL